jgi:hypothetical protein
LNEKKIKERSPLLECTLDDSYYYYFYEMGGNNEMQNKTHTHTHKIIPLSTTLLRNTGRRSYVVQIDYRDMQITALHDTLFSTNFTCC